ncbi:TspO/MBR family protein [Salinicola rhizosphaerae]|uniref:Tryptophan-rich sensory protein n=1 Tax=Salinicola rhizosphaerae TaxID=1443141 RepID=A0ABQ3E3E9_9GAMM|nr:TspO/MBR family protein [Salinicola rhizosphaerae]GHB22119.1 tryptophan-rich sensory protein [Salinicola rhizosphaerae]
MSRSSRLLIGWLLLVAIAASSGILAPPGAWYAALEKPPLTPPDWLFPTAWTLLYVMMAVAAWRVTLMAPANRRRQALTPFVAQLVANGLWSWLFFAAHWMLLGLLDLLLLWGLIVWTLVSFSRHSRLAVWLLVPYLVWVSFAVYLNAALWVLNATFP